jgi:hypothetical protein
MKRIALIAASALLGVASFANAETVLNGAEMDQVTAGLFGWAFTSGVAASAGDIDTVSLTASVSEVDLTGAVYATPTAISASASTSAAAGFLGAVASSSAGSYAELGN